ncbi:protein kinase domain-containing protein [Pectobacterium carotovorum]|uniref:protein kinase domain-containing protein n=1 Tax=Pectobacterium carotovorum TaxID=554 RepID=UPI003017DBE1
MAEHIVDDSPAKRLSGMILNEKWRVGERLIVGVQAGGNGTGGNFSVSYKVKSIDNKTHAFLKAFDFHKTLKKATSENRDVMTILAKLTSDYQFENKINEICVSKRFKKIVKVLDKGQIVLENNFLNVVPFLVMEMADSGDIRKYVEVSSKINLVAKLEYLKDIVLGLNQLHGAMISHQDLKPSNIMVFSDHGAKIGDLGRASLHGKPHWHDELDVAGDRGYAPPEQLYGFRPEEWTDRRLKCDLYQLGSIISFLFLGVTINGLMKENLPKDIAPLLWGGSGDSYEESLHHLEHSFNEVLIRFNEIQPKWLGERLKSIVSRCSHPDYKKRGIIKTVGMKKPILGLDRLVSEFDLCIKQVTIKGDVN